MKPRKENHVLWGQPGDHIAFALVTGRFQIGDESHVNRLIFMANDIPEKRRKLVSRIYDGAMKPSAYNDIFRAWDEHFDALTQSSDGAEPTDFDWMEEFIDHFDQAGKVFEKLSSSANRSLCDRIRSMRYIALVCDKLGVISDMNEYAEAFFGGEAQGSAFDLNLEPQSQSILSAFFKRLGENAMSASDDRIIIRIFGKDSEEASIFLAETVFDEHSETPKWKVLLRSITSVWHPSVGRALSAAFDLTQAELDLVQNLYRGLTIKEIARWKERSEATLRSQLSSVLHKTGTKTQAELSRIIAGLVNVLDDGDDPPGHETAANAVADASLQRRYTMQVDEDFILEVVESGDLAGRPFFFVQTTTMPTLTPEIVVALSKRNIRLVSVMRSGVGQSTKGPLSMKPAEWAQLYVRAARDILDGPWVFGGHCSGGIYALEMAKLATDICKGVMLVDTGAPLRRASMVYQMPKAPRRLFLAARFFPVVLRTPYDLVRNDFYSGTEGHRRGVEYFVDGSPVDAALVRDPYFWNIVKDNFDYCMKNHFRAARDVVYWSRDTSQLFADVAQKMPLHFYHGAQNFVHRAENISRFCATQPRCSHSISDVHGQLLIYADPAGFTDEIARFQSTAFENPACPAALEMADPQKDQAQNHRQ